MGGLNLFQGQTARWYVMALGSDHDMHSMRWQGNTVLYAGSRISASLLLPMSSAVVDMKASNPGTWKIDCDVVDHRLTGMNALYTVKQHVHNYVKKVGADFVQWSDSAIQPAPAPNPTQLGMVTSLSVTTLVISLILGVTIIVLLVVFYICTVKTINKLQDEVHPGPP